MLMFFQKMKNGFGLLRLMRSISVLTVAIRAAMVKMPAIVFD